MSSSRANIKNLMKRLNVLSDIPEERVGPDGRPASQVSHREKAEGKRGSTQTTISEISTATTEVGTGLGIDTQTHKASIAPHSPQAGDILFVPQDVKTATPFGPNHEYKAVPSIIEYSTARGRSRVSVREATPEEALEAAGTNMPIISEVPEFSQPPNPNAGQQPSGNVPFLAPPPNYQPVRVNRSPANDALRTSSASDQSIRTSTTSIRTSTIPDLSLRASTASDQSIRTSTATHDDSHLFETGSDTATLNPPGSPPQRTTAHAGKYSEHYSEKPPSSAGSWPLHHGSSNGSMRARGSTAHSLPSSMDASQSRFSWHVSRTDRTKNWFTRWFIEWWALEILSWCFSALCMMIILIVLWKVDGKPMPSWKLGISINAFISIFSGFAKSALLLPTAEALGQLKWSWFRKKERKMMDFEVMDGASRGAWGSMILLGKTKGITLASVGAAIILLSLPLDLFFQQIVSYPTQALVDPSANATISRAIQYNPNQEEQYRGGESMISEDSQFDSFIYPYWLGSGVVPGVEFDCPTGNCTWSPFHTLGFGFQCKAIPSTLLEFGCKNTSAEWLSTVAYEGPGTNPNVTSCGYYLNVPEDMPQLMSGYEITKDGSVGEVLATRFFAMSDVYTNTQFFGGSINFKDVKNPLVDFILVSTPDGFDGATRNNTPVITECEIHWDVKKMNSQVINGVLTEEVLEVLDFPSDLPMPWDPTNSDVYLADFEMTLPDIHSFTGPSSTYGCNNITARKVWQVWAEIAPSTFTRPAESNPAKSGPVLKALWLTGAPAHLLKAYDPILPWDSPNNVSAHMSEAVTVMNQIIRRNTLSETHRHDVAVGQSVKYTVLVHIRWQWITLPATLLIFALIFLTVTIWKSAKDKEQIGIWKTSALAILFNGLGEDVQGYVGAGNKKMGYTRQKANDIKVHLDDD